MKFSYGQVRFLLYLAVLFVPFTSLRFGLFGLGEAFYLIALVSMLLLNRGTFRKGAVLAPLTQFWLLYLVLITLGLAYNVLVLDFLTGSVAGATFDFTSYCVIASVLLVLGDERLYRGSSPESFFAMIFSIWGVAFSVLYVLSIFTPAIFGYPLRYYAYFSPLVDNVHQAAMITSAMPFVMWHLASMHGSLVRRGLYAVAGGLFVVMALESGSTKAQMAVVVGASVSAFFLCWHAIPASDKATRLVMVGLISVAGILLVPLNFESLIELGARFFQEHDGHSARENLYQIGFEVGMTSFLFGHGPGPHISLGADGGFSDAHNTALTIFLQGGVLAFAALAVAIWRVTSSITSYAFLVGSMTAVLMYFLGGDILRRLPIWIIIAGLVYLSGSFARSSSVRARLPQSEDRATFPRSL